MEVTPKAPYLTTRRRLAAAIRSDVRSKIISELLPEPFAWLLLGKRPIALYQVPETLMARVEAAE